MTLMSDRVMWAIIYVAVVGICVGWGARDVYLLRKHWARRQKAHDQVFGSIMGLLIIAIGLIGLLKHLKGW